MYDNKINLCGKQINKRKTGKFYYRFSIINYFLQIVKKNGGFYNDGVSIKKA